MKFFKILFLSLFCLFTINEADSQVQFSPWGIYYNGSGSYPGIVKVAMTTTLSSQSSTFSAAGTLTTLSPVQSFNISVYKYNTSSGPIVGPIVWTIYNWNSNSLIINQPYPIYIDDHNGKTWYLYIEKLEAGMRCWIAN